MAILTNKGIKQMQNILIQAILPDLNKQTGESKYLKNWNPQKTEFHAVGKIDGGFEIMVHRERGRNFEKPTIVSVIIGEYDPCGYSDKVFQFFIDDHKIYFSEKFGYDGNDVPDECENINPFRQGFVTQLFHDLFYLNVCRIKKDYDGITIISDDVDLLKWSLKEYYQEVDCEVEYRMGVSEDNVATWRIEAMV